MAIPHFQVTPQSRKKGASAIAKAAYNAGDKLHELDGRLHLYDRKGGIRYRALIYSPSWEMEEETREAFWQSVELGEKRKDACVSREIQAALPRELTYEQNLKLVREWVNLIIERYSLKAADLSIHYPTKHHRKSYAKKDQENPHFHLLIPDRDANGHKLRMFCHNPQEIILLRDIWEKHVNTHLAAAGETARISLKTNKAQIATLDQEITTLQQRERELIGELQKIEVKTNGIDTGKFSELCPGNQAHPAREISGGYDSGKQRTPACGTEPQEATASPKSGFSSGDADNKRGTRQAGGPTGQGTIPNAGKNSRRSGVPRKPSKSARGKPTKHPPQILQNLARKIASRIDGLRFQRQKELNNRTFSKLASKLASRIDGLRYERQHEYEQQIEQQIQDTTRISDQTR